MASTPRDCTMTTTKKTKVVDSEYLQIHEDEKYKMWLCNNADEHVHLYRVTPWNPTTGLFVRTIYVLASGRRGAIGQACCGTEVDDLEIQDQDNFRVMTLCERVPVKLRGWGSHEF